MKLRDNWFQVSVLSCIALISGCSTTRTTTQVVSNQKVFEIIDSRWTLAYETSKFGKREYGIVFRDGGRLDDLHPNNSTPDNDSWEQQGEMIILKQNDGFSIYKGEILNENTMSGSAKSRTGGTWQWRAIRK